ncbi:transcription initiation factor TFIID subunit 3 isoform X2 [Coregonus clupeaformis]|uniref:transcription initiation factor TFIID subunit 3 isoform X2 n=1 Tax=Coregonus clupeaformis TaxID=59861 RepID=UPI001BDF7FC2|nr:transcription initiation factor TFIID subunit 3 isoform X2 [Coregonus clupeaformis]
MIRAEPQELFQGYVTFISTGRKMEGTLDKEKPELEYDDNLDDNQGGIRRRLRDRDLLKKRKAEAEEKATNQVESRRKRVRGREEKSSSGRRGRPRKTDPTPELPASQEEPEQEAVIVKVVSKPVEVTPAPTLISLSPFLPVDPSPPESLPAYVPPVPAPIPFLAPAPVPVVAPSPMYNPVTAPALSPLETLYTKGSDQGSDPLDQVLIEDLGPDEKEDIPPSQNNQGTDQGSPLALLQKIIRQETSSEIHADLASDNIHTDYMHSNLFCQHVHLD